MDSRDIITKLRNQIGYFKYRNKEEPNKLYSYSVLLNCDDAFVDFFEETYKRVTKERVRVVNTGRTDRVRINLENPRRGYKKLSRVLNGFKKKKEDFTDELIESLEELMEFL